MQWGLARFYNSSRKGISSRKTPGTFQDIHFQWGLPEVHVRREVKILMKGIVLLTFALIGCIQMTGCIGQMKNASVNATTVNSTITFTPLSNTTGVSDIPTSTNSSGLKGEDGIPVPKSHSSASFAAVQT